MADRKISELTALTAPAAGDYLPIVDISEAAAVSRNKRITIEELLRGAPDGTAAAPSVAFESSGSNGIYLAGTNTIGISTNGTNRVSVSTTAVTSALPVALSGSTSGSVTLQPVAVAGSTVITLPATTGTVVTTGDSGTVTSTMIADGTIVNADINASAAIAGTKISPNFGSQNVTTTGTSTAASFIPSSSTAPTNGLYLPAANSVALATGGTQRLSINSNGTLSSTSTGANVANFIGPANAYVDITDGTGIFRTQLTSNTPFIGAASNHGLVLTTNNTERLRITSGGLVGIGTSSPGAQFEVVKDSTYNNEISFGFSITDGTSDVKLGCGVDATNNISFIQSLDPGTAYNTRPLILNPNGGNVGINTTSPGYLLDVNGTTKITSNSINDSYFGYGANFDNYFTCGTSGAQIFRKYNTETARIDSSGNFGIGTSSPSAPLTFGKAVYAAPTSEDFYRIKIEDLGGIANDVGLGQTGSGSLGINCSNTGNIIFHKGGTETARIDSSGRLGIGTSSPGYTLDVNGSVRFTNGANPYLALYNGSNTAYVQIASGDLNFTSPSSGNITFSLPATGEAVRIDTSKRLLVGTSSSSGANRAVFAGSTFSATSVGIVQIARGSANPVTNDDLARLEFTDSNAAIGARIESSADGNWTAGSSYPGRLVFSTTAGGASSPTERARINNTGYLTGTVNGLSQGLYQAQQYYRLNADLAGSDVNTAQSIFGVGVTLIASTVYEFEMVYTLSKTAGTTSHTIGVGFGGTATLNNIFYELVGTSAALAFPSVSTPDVFNTVQAATNTTMTAAGATATRNFRVIAKGTVSVNAGGTFIPQYTLSAAPGGAYSTLTGSYVKIAPLSASGANTSIGSWA